MGRGENGPARMFSLKRQIFIFLAVFIFVILLLLGIFLAAMIASYQKSGKQRRQEELEEYAQTLDGSIQQLNEVVRLICTADNSFQGISGRQTAAERCGTVYGLRSTLQMQIRSNHYLEGLFVLYEDGEKVLYDTNGQMDYGDIKLMWNTGKALMEYSRIEYSGNSAFSYTEQVQQTKTGQFYSIYMKKDAALVSGSISLLQGLPEQAKDADYGIIYRGKFYRTAGAGAEFSAADGAALKPGRNRIGNNLVYLCKLGAKDMAAVEIVPQSFWMYVQPWHMVFLLVMVFLAAWLAFLYRFIYLQLSEPLEDMTRTLRDIRKGDWEVHFTAPNRIAEIEGVRTTVRLMLREIGQYKIRTYEEQLARQNTQLQFLQLQLAPHFYTNCLKNIYYMLKMEEYENAEQFLLCLSRHLRYLLQRDAVFVTVAAEKDFVVNYISLQKHLSSRKVACTISADPAAEGKEIPILALQTFVENSVKYAQGDKEQELKIWIQVRLIGTGNESRLDIIVRDNGRGYPAGMPAMLNRKRDLSADRDSGVGIQNLLCRLKIHYGDGAEWYFENREGAFSEIILPQEH